jgi:thiol-disulfide isomerase/thioredoxin
MKNLICLAVVVCIVVLSSCGDDKNTFTITGTVPYSNLNGQMVYMSDLNDGQIVDSVVINDGKFIFKGTADSAIFINLTINDLASYIILEKGNFTVDMGEPYSAKGNSLTKELDEFFLKNHGLFNEVVISGPPDSERWGEYLARLDDLSAPYLKKHPNDLLGAMVFMNKIEALSQIDLSMESFNKAKEGIGEKILNFGPVKKMTLTFENVTKTSVGKIFTDFTIENGNLDNTPAKFSDYIGKGKYILVDFWASWCGPCLREIPNLKKVYEKYKGDKFDILGVAVWDKRDATLKAIEEEGIKWNQIIDAQMIPTEIYGIQGIPHIILFAPDGSIVARNLRDSAIGEKVAEVLK